MESKILLTPLFPMELSPTETHPPVPLMETLKRVDGRKTVFLIETVYKKTVLYLMSIISIYMLVFRRETVRSEFGMVVCRVPSTATPPGGI